MKDKEPAYICSVEPKQQNVRLGWAGGAARPKTLNTYCVRIRQEGGAIAWGSPLWIHCEP